MRGLIGRLPHELTAVNFEETIQLESVQKVTRLWLADGKLIAFAYVDPWNNLRFEMDVAERTEQLEDEIVAWGVACVCERNRATDKKDRLGSAFTAKHDWQIGMMMRCGFVEEGMRTLRYGRLLTQPIHPQPLPDGFSIRSVAGEQEVETLVALHRAAFGTDNMTVAQRLAIMRVPTYRPELDLLVIAPNGETAAFCIGSVEDGVGFTDPIGTHPRYQRLGLGRAVVTAGLQRLQGLGVTAVMLFIGSGGGLWIGIAEGIKPDSIRPLLNKIGQWWLRAGGYL